MLRATFFSFGMFVGMWGMTFLYVDRLVIHPGDGAREGERPPGIRGMLAQQDVNHKRLPVIDPPEWMAFFLMSVGSVTMLYSVALPKQG